MHAALRLEGAAERLAGNGNAANRARLIGRSVARYPFFSSGAARISDQNTLYFEFGA